MGYEDDDNDMDPMDSGVSLAPSRIGVLVFSEKDFASAHLFYTQHEVDAFKRGVGVAADLYAGHGCVVYTVGDKEDEENMNEYINLPEVEKAMAALEKKRSETK